MQQRDAELSVLIGMLRKDDAANGSMPAACASRAPHHPAEGHALDMASASLRDQTAQSNGEEPVCRHTNSAHQHAAMASAGASTITVPNP